MVRIQTLKILRITIRFIILYQIISYANIFVFMKDELHKRKIRKLEERLVNAEAANSSLQRKCDAHVNVKSNLENEVNIQAFEINCIFEL